MLRGLFKISNRAAAIALVALAALGSGIVIAAGAKPDFAVATSPTSLTTTQGQSATYTVTVTRQNKFDEPVALSVTGLPAFATATFAAGAAVRGAVSSSEAAEATRKAALKRCLRSARRKKAAKRRKAAVKRCRAAAARAKGSVSASASQTQTGSDQSTMVIRTNQGGTTPTGTYALKVTATGTKKRDIRTTTATLVVLSAGEPGFTLNLTPAAQTIVQSDDAVYSVAVSRTGGFAGAVNLTSAMIPENATASLVPAQLTTATPSSAFTVATTDKTKPASYQVWVVGKGTAANGSAITRLAMVSLIVETNRALGLAGDLAGDLAPGFGQPLDLAITNPQNFAIQVRNLAVQVEEDTGNPGCSGTENFEVEQVPAARYPITVPAGSTRRLSELGVGDLDKPFVRMLDLTTNQDACKGARIHLQYSASATK